MFLPCRKACEYYGVCAPTLRKLAQEGKIKTIATPGNKKLYECITLNEDNKEKEIKRSYCYCRVNKPEQEDELDKQILFFKKKYPEYITLTDIGSGLDLKRPNLILLLDECLNDKVDKIIVQNRDALAQVGFDLLEWLFKRKKIKFIDLDMKKNKKDVSNISSILSILSGMSK